MKEVKISTIRKGTLFLLKPYEGVFIPMHLFFMRGQYNRSTKKYTVLRWTDFKQSFEVESDKIVFI